MLEKPKPFVYKERRGGRKTREIKESSQTQLFVWLLPTDSTLNTSSTDLHNIEFDWNIFQHCQHVPPDSRTEEAVWSSVRVHPAKHGQHWCGSVNVTTLLWWSRVVKGRETVVSDFVIQFGWILLIIPLRNMTTTNLTLHNIVVTV